MTTLNSSGAPRSTGIKVKPGQKRKARKRLPENHRIASSAFQRPHKSQASESSWDVPGVRNTLIFINTKTVQFDENVMISRMIVLLDRYSACFLGVVFFLVYVLRSRLNLICNLHRSVDINMSHEICSDKNIRIHAFSEKYQDNDRNRGK
ncbi:hypothetical protein HN011_002385 [Eciton burchellii]|nr:hypothetical protein HN011_002385 [Eciton burchellii]